MTRAKPCHRLARRKVLSTAKGMVETLRFLPSRINGTALLKNAKTLLHLNVPPSLIDCRRY